MGACQVLSKLRANAGSRAEPAYFAPAMACNRVKCPISNASQCRLQWSRWRARIVAAAAALALAATLELAILTCRFSPNIFSREASHEFRHRAKSVRKDESRGQPFCPSRRSAARSVAGDAI